MTIPEGFVELANQRFEESKKFWRNWRSETRDNFAFVSGEQWLPDDVITLTAQKRPPVTFNYSEKMIDAVVGAEISNRQEITYTPREMSDAPLAELWTNAAKWARDLGDHEDEETDAFRDCLICGMGWTLTKMNYESDLDGLIDCGRVDPVEMYSDPSAVKPSIIDRRYNFRMWWVDERIAKRRWPTAIGWAVDAENMNMGVDVTTRIHYDDGETSDEREQHRGKVQVRHYECVENEPFYRVATEQSTIEVSAADFSDLKDSLDEANISYVRQTKRVFYHGYFVGDTKVEASESPCQTGFCYQAITGKRDRNRGTWYGLTKVMKDPQRWANKWLSQIMHIINSNAKGGLLAETGAFVDPLKAQDTYAQPDSIVFLKEGALSGKKVMEKSMVNYPQGLDRLMEFALASLPQVTGINLEALGLAGREQANVLEQSRKQAAYGLLAPVFDSLRRYRKNQGRVLLYFIDTYISDGRLIRIGGPESQQFVPLTKADKATTMDVMVDQSPDAPDIKQKTWGILESMLPALLKAGIPLPPDLLDFVPVPTAMARKWKDYIAKNPPVNQQQVQQMQQQVQQTQDENQKLKQALADKQKEFELEQQKAKAELELEEYKMKKQMELADMKAKAEYNLKELQANHEAHLAQQKNEADISNQNAQMEIKKQQAETSGQNESQKNVMGAVNELVGIIAKLNADDAKDN